eukprot:436668-Prorocentrum_minimum.AAC.1
MNGGRRTRCGQTSTSRGIRAPSLSVFPNPAPGPPSTAPTTPFRWTLTTSAGASAPPSPPRSPPKRQTPNRGTPATART